MGTKVEEQAVRPGDRVWVTGKLVQGAQGMEFARRATLDDKHPKDRAEVLRTHALLAGGVAALGGGMSVFLLL
jgi:thiamine monophosphate kinase